MLAREFGLPATTNYQELLAAKAVDLIVDVTGDPAVARVIHKLKADGTDVIGGGNCRIPFSAGENTPFGHGPPSTVPSASRPEYSKVSSPASPTYALGHFGPVGQGGQRGLPGRALRRLLYLEATYQWGINR